MRYKPAVIYSLLTVGTGLLSKSEALSPLAFGLSIFIPALFYVLSKEDGPGVALLITAVALGVLALYDYKLAADLSALPVIGLFLYFGRNRLSTENLVLLGAALLFASAVLEEIAFGLPEPVRKVELFVKYRFGFYALSSLLLSYFMTAVAQGITGEKWKVEELRFGFWSVILFLLSGTVFLIIKEGPLHEMGINLLIASISLFTVQGISVILYAVRRLGSLWKLTLLISALLFPILILGFSTFLGLLDQAIDFRKKLYEGGKDGSNSD